MGTFLLVNICSASRDTGKFFLCSLFFLLLSNLTLQAQTEQEWEIVDDSKLAWTPSSNLSVYNNSLKDLSVANLIAEDKETKKNNSWHAEYVTLGISWEETRPYEISFTIRNNNNRPDYKYKVYREKRKTKRRMAQRVHLLGIPDTSKRQILRETLLYTMLFQPEKLQQCLHLYGQLQ